MSDTKRTCSRPMIVRVQLNHEQAVLAACSTTTSSLQNTTGAFCKNGCRRNISSAGRDNATSS